MSDFDGTKPAKIWPVTGMALAIFLLVLGSKLVLLKAFASPLPFWDQWDAEAANLYKPYLNGTLDWQVLFSSHNEHRIFFPRLLALGLFELAGQWDPVLQMIVNAGMHAVFSGVLFAVLAGLVAPSRHMALAVFTAITFIIPIGWENLLSGFQSQFYFLLLFSLGALYLFLRGHALSWRWLLAVVLSVCAYFSMSSGALTVAAAIPVLLLQIVAGVRGRSWPEFASLVILTAITAVMIYFITDVPGHDALKAHSLLEIVTAIISISALPLATVFGTAFVQFPLFWLAFAVFRQRPALVSIAWLMLGLAGWIGTQMLSLAVGRAAVVMSSRYLDLLIVAYPISLAALFVLTAKGQRLAQLPAIWGAVMITAIVAVGYTGTWSSILARHGLTEVQQQNVAQYYATGDLSVLTNAEFMHIPYPDSNRLAGLLDDTTIRAALHESVRPTDGDVAGMLSHTRLKGHLANVVALLRDALLVAGPILFALGFGLAFLLCSRRRLDADPI